MGDGGGGQLNSVAHGARSLVVKPCKVPKGKSSSDKPLETTKEDDQHTINANWCQ